MSNYIISDAAKIIDVENHVLRNWEEELCLKIPRNDMGHRIYTDDNIIQLQTIKRLKYYGFSLKHIKLLIPYFHKINTLSTNELLSLKDNFYNAIHSKNTSNISDDNLHYDKLKSIIHYIIVDYVNTMIKSISI